MLLARTLVPLALISGLVLYPLLMIFAAAVAPAFSDSQALELSDLFRERLRAASISTLRLGVAVSLLSVMTGAALALLAAQTRHERWIDLMILLKNPPFILREPQDERRSV